MLAATDRLGLLYRQSNMRCRGMAQYKEKVTLSGTSCPAGGVMVWCYGCYAHVWQFDFSLANFHFLFFFDFFQAPCRCYI